MSARLAIVTATELTTPDVDETLLLPLLPHARLVCWDDPTVDWSSFDVAVLRSTWNYTDHLDAFLAWAEHVDSVSRLVNPLPVIRWNTDKRYLGAIAAAGLPVVPTRYVAAGDAVPADALGGRVVVKPTVGAGSKGAALFSEDPAAAHAHVDALRAAGKVAMVQPYLDAVDAQGETALVFVGGQFSHAARKAAILSREMSWSTGLYADEKIVPSTPSAAERELAEAILASLPDLVDGGGDIAYARVDLLPGPDGPVLLELELTEPSLFLAMDSGAPARAAAVLGALARR